jgi:primosomal protein N' (replication factor Y) (superfamily II helicase)
MTDYVEVVVPLPGVNGTFSYHLPSELMGRVEPGCLVIVPFGRQTVQGVVLRKLDFPPEMETKPVLELVDPSPVITPWQFKLAAWLVDETLAPLASALDLMIPSGLAQHADTHYHLMDNEDSSSDLPQTQRRLVDLLQTRGDLRGRQIDSAMPHTDWQAAARPLIRNGVISKSSILPPPRVRPKFVKTARIGCPWERID